jgi:hypothetical protein
MKIIRLLLILAAAISVFYVSLFILVMTGIRVVIPPDGSETLLVNGHMDMPFIMDPRQLCSEDHNGDDPSCPNKKMGAILTDGRVLYRTSSDWLLRTGRFLDSL